MAYGLKYTQYIEKGGALVRINVYEKDWTGGSYGMAHVVGASLQIIGGQSNVIAPIIKTAFSFSLVDAYDEGTPNSDGTTCINPDGEKCGQWEEFFTPDATKYKVEVTSKPAPGASESVIWTGFITPDSWSENMIYRGVITVTARDMIGALQEKEFDLTGRVSVRDLIAGAMSACECPMQLQLTEAHFLANSNGNSIIDHTFAASVFAGDTWYQALEDTLDSLGLVLRYNGANRIVLTSLRYIAGDTTRGSHEIEFVSRSGLRQLDPAIRSITETFDASLVRLAVDDPDPSQYTATGEYNVQRAPCSYSLPHDVNIPRYTLTGPIQPTEWLGSLAVPRPTQIYQGGGAIPERDIYFPTDIITEGVSATVQTNNIKAPFSFRINQDGPVMRYQVNGATTIVSALAKFQDIALSKIHVVVRASVDGQARYLGADGAWSTAQTIHEIDPGAEVVVPALSGGESFAIIITKLDTAYTGDWQLPVSTVVALNVELSPAQSSTTPTEFKTTTEYDQANNVVITRKPKIGSAGISSSAPFAENVLAFGDDLAADEWNWPGEESYYPLAVMIQAQVLCYYSAPASIFTGTAHDKAADVAAALPGYMFEYYDRDGVILSGTYGFTAGFISQINAREVYGWEDVWGAGFDPEYTAQSGAGKGSTSATGPGGGSASSGGASSTPAVGLNYFEPNEDRASLIQLKPAYDYLGPRKGLIFGRSSSEDENVDLEVVNIAGAGDEPVYALHSKLPFYSDSFVSAGGISDGPGSTGIDLAAMWASLQNTSADHTYDSAKIAGAHIPDMATTYGYLKQADIDPILALIPAQASSTNQLADKAFVNSSIATATSTYRGNYNEYSDLNLNPSATHAQVATKLGMVISEADANDYCFVEIPTSASTPTQIERTERYKYNGTGWEYEYTLNNSGFTAVQWAAINSNITAGKVSTYDTVAGYFDANGKLGTSHLPAMYIGDAQVQTSAQTAQNVGGLGNVTMGWNKYLYMLDENGTAKELVRFYKLSSTTIMRFGGGNTGATNMTLLTGGSELRFQTGRDTATTHLSLTENSSGSKSARLYGNLVMSNAAALNIYENLAEGATPQAFRAVFASTANILYFGDGTIAKDYQTRVYGSPLAFYTGSSSMSAANRLTITADGIIRPYVDIVPNSPDAIDLGSASRFFAEAYAKKVYLAADTYLEVDSNGYVHLVTPSGKGFYCDGFVSAGGISDGQGSTGIDLAAMWASLQNQGSVHTYDSYLIASAHIPDMSSVYGYLKSADISDMATKTWVAAQNFYNNANLTASAVVGILGTTPVNRATADGSGNTISSTYLKLSGGTMTGDIKMTNGEYIISESGLSMLGINAAGTTFYCGPGAEITSSFFIRSGDINLIHVRTGTNYTIWDAANSNLDSVNWACNNLSAAGNVTLSGALYLQNNKQIYWKDKPAGEASEKILGLLNITTSNVFTLGSGLIETGDNARAYNTYLYGGIIYFYTGDTTTGATRKWYISRAGDFIPNGEYRIGSSSNYVAEAYAKKVYLAANTYLEVDSNGYVHLVTPSGKGFYCDGFASAGGVASSSDERLKANIKDFNYSAELLMSLKPREWDWNGKTPMVGHSAGFVAQEVEPHLPYAVTERTYKQLTYDIFHALEVSALQDHETHIQDHETRIKALEAENRKKDAKIENLENEIKRLRAI